MSGPNRRHRCGGFDVVTLPIPGPMVSGTPYLMKVGVRPLGAAIRWTIVPAGTPTNEDFSAGWNAAVTSDASGWASWTFTAIPIPNPVLHVAMDKNIRNRAHVLMPTIV